MLVIPCRTDLAHYVMSLALDGTTYSLEFRWNTREASWYMTVGTVDGSPIVASQRVCVGNPLVFRSNDPRRPPGIFYALDTTGAQVDPGQADLGDRVTLYYLEAADLAAL